MTKQRLLQRITQLPGGNLWAFGIKQAWAALFGGLLLAAIIATEYLDLPLMARYDWLFVFAVLVQLGMLLTKLEKPHEVLTILLFHMVGLGMELFKTSSSIGSWHYPGEAVIRLGNVPLFSGFMYAAVGSYIARSWRVMNLRFAPYPRRRWTAIFAAAIYINFFTHHYMWDMRWALFICLCILYGRTTVWYVISKRQHRMPLLLGFFLVSLFIWIAENIATSMHIWLYPDQTIHWHMVSPQKIGSWLLLMIISFIFVDLLYFIRAWWSQRNITR